MPPIRQLRVIVVAVASVAVAMTLLLVQALRQLPLDQLHPLALAALAGCAIALLAADASVAAALLPSAKRRISRLLAELGS